MGKAYGEELRKAVLATKKAMQEAIDNRAERIKNWETDMDDCFVSKHVEENAIMECNMQLEILDTDGTQEFEIIVDENGNEVHTHWFTNRYGGDTIVGNGVFASSEKALLKKTGWHKEIRRFPVWTKFCSSGRGIFGVMGGSTEIVRWHTNMVTGEYVGF